MISGLGLTLAFAGLWIARTAWLCGRPDIWSRRAGMVLATVVASYCPGVALIGIATVLSARRGPVKSS